MDNKCGTISNSEYMVYIMYGTGIAILSDSAVKTGKTSACHIEVLYYL